jgi:N-methylhydantoinase A
MTFICGIDTGGTFTDAVVMDARGQIVTAKVPSTPHDFSQGVMDALQLIADKLGVSVEQLLQDTSRLALGTTVGTNAMLQRRGARVGLITTKGHRDVIHIMRGARGVPGVASELVLHFPESNKPDPIVPKTLIAEVSERVDCMGERKFLCHCYARAETIKYATRLRPRSGRQAWRFRSPGPQLCRLP